ncbi:unnamed protein product, partial [Brassica rapa subsp. narinosa]
IIHLHKALSSEFRSPPSQLYSSSPVICLATSDSRHHNHHAKLNLRKQRFYGLSKKKYQAKILKDSAN